MNNELIITTAINEIDDIINKLTDSVKKMDETIKLLKEENKKLLDQINESEKPQINCFGWIIKS